MCLERRFLWRIYNPFGTNCNDFSNKLSVWLCGKKIPYKHFNQDVTTLQIASIPAAIFLGPLSGILIVGAAALTKAKKLKTFLGTNCVRQIENTEKEKWKTNEIQLKSIKYTNQTTLPYDYNQIYLFFFFK